jgi:hypothetical protein
MTTRPKLKRRPDSTLRSRWLTAFALALLPAAALAQQPLNTLPAFGAESHRIFETDAASPAIQ